MPPKPQKPPAQRVRKSGHPPSSSPVERLTVRVPGAAQMLDISENCVWDLIRTHEVRVSRHGNVTLVWVDSLREYLQRHADRMPDIRGPRRKERAAAIASDIADPSKRKAAQPADQGE